MAVEHLSRTEIRLLDEFVVSGQINRKMILPSVSKSDDSMGVGRNPKTDQFFPGTADAYSRHSATLLEYNLMFVVATNGPDKEGEEILNCLEGPVAAYAITQGGGKMIARHPITGKLEHTVLAEPTEIEFLGELEEVVSERPLMRALLGDKYPDGKQTPIRTPYDANLVLTMPPSLEQLNARLSAVGVNLQDELSGIGPDNYLEQILGYAHDQFIKAIMERKLADSLAAFIKRTNRRIYVTPKHLKGGLELSKYSGVLVGSEYLSAIWGDLNYRLYQLGNSIYTADNAVDETREEGQVVLGASERSMIKGTYVSDKYPDPSKINVTNIRSVPVRINGMRTLCVADEEVRLAINVTLDNRPPSMNIVEGVSILNIGSGIKAIEAADHLFRRLHG